MGVVVRSSTIIRFITAVLGEIAFIVFALIGGPDQKTFVIAAILTAVIIYSNFRELAEESAHMAHHMPKLPKGVSDNEGNHESRTYSGR